MLHRLAVLLVLAMIVTGTAGAPARAQQEATAFTLPGLDGDVTIHWDALGVPHIYATTSHDLVMAQGYVHAADRWWQMEWFRAQGSGRLSEIGGSPLVETDSYLRTLGLARNAQNDLDHLPDDVLGLLQAYADGVNAWLAGKAPGDAAIEYTVANQLREGLGAPPVTAIEPWTPLNSATWLQVMALGLGANMDAELLRLRLINEFGEDALATLAPSYDYAHQPLILEPGWTPAPVTAHQAEPLPALATLPGLETVAALRDVGLGSNNWVVSGARTASGLPLLANDPHLPILMPSIWYEVGLHCVEISDACPFDVSGFSFAGVPFIVIGHNRDIAWGVTNVGTDVQDLYLLELNPANPRQYRYEGEWLDMEVITETIRPFDADPVTLEVELTRFGPVVTEVIGADQPVALRWAAADPSRNFSALLTINAARNWDEFQQGVSLFDLAAQNFVYADVEGNIGYITSGRISLRAEGHDGSRPVPGTSAAYEWRGYVDPLDNPRLFNPAAGYIVTANNAVAAPEDFPFTIASEWSYGYRAARIETLLQAQDAHTLDSLATIQFDNYNSAAALTVPWLAALDLGDARLEEAVAWLGEWDLQNDADSPHAALFNAFWDRFVPLVFDEVPFWEESFTIYRLSLILDDPASPLWANAETGQSDPAALVAGALGEALDFMEGTYGADWMAWQWGDLHVARFQAAPIGQLPEGLDPRLDQALPVLRAVFNRETPASGGPEVINATGWRVGSGDFSLTSLPSMRMILDLSDWDNSRMVHTTGQSGSPQSEHYADMIPLWSSGQYHAHRFSAEAVRAHAVGTWLLTPRE
ncbi:MAG: penicillin acylase family protein [Chloroflexota bacterium]|jgi:penicillin amidase